MDTTPTVGTAARVEALGERLASRWATVILATVVAIFIGVTQWAGADLERLDPDSVVRLVQVRDFLNGQGWFDTTQYRMGAPGGVIMHWSRLIDLPIAALVRLFGMFVQPATAEMLAINIWPLLLLIPFVVIASETAVLLSNRNARPWTTFFLLLSPLAVVFAPGLIDHHSAQILVVSLMIFGAIEAGTSARRGTWWWAILSGAALGTSVAIGPEMVAVIATVVAYCAGSWVWRGGRFRGLFGGVCLGAAVSVLAWFVATVPMARWAIGSCDAISAFYLLVIGGGGAAMVAMLTVFPDRLDRRGRLARASALAVAALCLLVALLLTYPACLRGPLAAIDPRLFPIWRSYIGESRGILLALTHLGAYPFLLLCLPIAVFAISGLCWRLIPPRLRWGAGLIVLAALVAFAITVVQIRGGAVMLSLLLPVSAGVTAIIRSSPRFAAGAASVARFVFVPLTPVVWIAIWGLVANPDRAGPNGGTRTNAVAPCTTGLFGPINQLPPGSILAEPNLAPMLLARSPHRVIAAHYHRNTEGLYHGILGLTEPPELAEGHVRAVAADYLLVCRQGVLFGATKSSLSMRILAGEIPQWLKPVLETDEFVLLEVLAEPPKSAIE